MAQPLGGQIEGKKDAFTKVLAVVGTALTWLPLLAPIVFALSLLVARGIFRFDYLMPAELFLLVVVGGWLLVWAALRARSRKGLIVGSFGAAIGLLVLSQALAVATGLASGAAEPSGAWFVLILGMIGIHDLAVAVMAVGGALLVRDLFK